MRYSVQTLHRELDFMRSTLGEGTFFSLTSDEKAALEQEAELLSRKLAAVESSLLLVGLLGGTGVGKSTIMNALAGIPIASASHRRPHTDRVLIYRHATSAPWNNAQLGEIPWNEITHQADPIRHVLLCDLPDFDSIIGAHRQSVLDFLDHLDILVWVSSPEKYADGRFYDFLTMVPKARENFLFVLNKVDLLFQGETRERGYEHLDRMIRSFEEHLREKGVKEPLVHAVSAQEALEDHPVSPWNHFVAFKHEIFQQRNVKQIAAIKTANLDVEIQQFFSSFEKEARHLQGFIGILEDASTQLGEQRASWIQAGHEALHFWLENQIRPGTLEYQGEPFPLVGPGYVIALVFQYLQGKGSGFSKGSLDFSSLTPSEQVLSVFQRRLEWVEEHIGHALLRRSLAPRFLEMLRERLDVKRKFETLGENFFHALASFAAEAVLPRLQGFRVFQWFTYIIIFCLFLIAIGGEKAWQNLLNHPGAFQVLSLLIALIHNLFSSRGLAALGSYVLMNLFLGFRFYRRYRKILQKSARDKERALGLSLSETWKASLDALIRDLGEVKGEVQSLLSALMRVRGENR